MHQRPSAYEADNQLLIYPAISKKGGGGDLRKCKKVPDNICNTTANSIWVGITTMADPARVELATHEFSVALPTELQVHF